MIQAYQRLSCQLLQGEDGEDFDSMLSDAACAVCVEPSDFRLCLGLAAP